MKKIAIRLKIFYSLFAVLMASTVYSQKAQEDLSSGNGKGSLLDLSGAVANNIKLTIPDPENSVNIISTEGAISEFESYNDYKDAIANYTETIKLFPNFESAYYYRGLARASNHEYRKAISDYNKTIMINPLNEKAYGNRGIAKENLKNYSGAIADFNKVIEINPLDAKAYLNRGVVRADCYKDYRGAIADYNKSIELNPEYAATYYNRGLANNQIKEYVSAIADFTEAIKLNPRDGEAYYNRGVAEFALGLTDTAYMDFSKAGEAGYIMAFETIRKYSKFRMSGNKWAKE